ncbi:hypothetical protein [Algoriphagus sp. NG3]|uniref:hypothetical protein n=1 Tax=Algoriphagus sp. NG3 TaxID=3097546 RepID=UPI002A80ED44|nr:hypothetical protein [Algoriphagus sp. NG3]WPR76264.1 hypothetical protein SLW71_02760 [Algoriphagus sp. NG3]
MNRTVLVKVDLEDNYSHKLDEAFQQVDEIINENNNQGYKVVSVTPLTASGNYYDNSENQSYGYGYSFTTGILIVFEEIEE